MQSSPLSGERPTAPERPFWVLWLLLALAVVYLPVFTGAIVFFRDPAHWNAPARFFLAEAWTHGESMTWNPQGGLGFPVMGSPLHGPFYPPNWIFLWAGHSPDPRATVAHLLTWASLAHLAFGSLGAGLLAARLGCGRAARLVAALAFGLSGYTTATWSAGLLLLAGAWVPWCGVVFEALVRDVLRRGSKPALLRRVALAALVVGLAILMGEVFVALMSLGFGLLTAAAVHAGAPQTTETGPRTRLLSRRNGVLALVLGAALALGVGTGAVTLLPARALVGSTQRGQPLPRVLAESCSLHPLRLVELLVPGAMGDALENYPAASVVGEAAVDGLPLAFSVYLGASVLALCALALGRGQRLALRVALLALTVLLVALGKHTPVHQLLRTVVPPLAYMRYPEKYLALFVPWVSLLAGLGAQRLQDAPTRAKRLVFFAPLVAAVGLLAALDAFPHGLRSPMLRGVLASALAIAAVGAMALVHRRRPKMAAAGLVVVVALDLATAAWPLQVFQPVSLAADVPPAARAVLDAEKKQPTLPLAGPASTAPLAAFALHPRVYRADAVEAAVRTFVPVANIGAGEFRSVLTLVPNTVTTFGLATVPGYDAAIPASLRLLWARGEHSGLRLLQLLAVPYAVLAVGPSAQTTEPRPSLTPLLDPLPGARLYRVPDVLPRVYLAGQGDRLPDRETFEHILDDDVIAGDRVLVAEDDAAKLPSFPTLGQPGRAGDCAFLSFHHDHLEAECRATRDAWVVFVEQHDQGWSATLDGRPTVLVRANLLLRSVFIPAGVHRIALTYEAPALKKAKLASGLSLAVVAVLFLGGALAARPRRSAPVEG